MVFIVQSRKDARHLWADVPLARFNCKVDAQRFIDETRTMYVMRRMVPPEFQIMIGSVL